MTMAPGKPSRDVVGAWQNRSHIFSAREYFPPPPVVPPCAVSFLVGAACWGVAVRSSTRVRAHRRRGFRQPSLRSLLPPRSSATSGPERRLISDMRGLRVHRCVGRPFVAGCAPSAPTLPTAAPPVEDRALARLVELLDEDLGSPVSLFCVSEVWGGGSNVGKAPRRAGEPLATRRPPFCFARRPALVQSPNHVPVDLSTRRRASLVRIGVGRPGGGRTCGVHLLVHDSYPRSASAQPPTPGQASLRSRAISETQPADRGEGGQESSRLTSRSRAATVDSDCTAYTCPPSCILCSALVCSALSMCVVIAPRRELVVHPRACRRGAGRDGDADAARTPAGARGDGGEGRVYAAWCASERGERGGVCRRPGGQARWCLACCGGCCDCLCACAPSPPVAPCPRGSSDACRVCRLRVQSVGGGRSVGSSLVKRQGGEQGKKSIPTPHRRMAICGASVDHLWKSSSPTQTHL